MRSSRPMTAGLVERIATAPPERSPVKPHPSISDYYKGARMKSGKLAYQQSNNSNVVFGDDRISVRKSMAQEVDASSNIEAGRTSFRKVNHTQLQRMSRDERASHYRNASRVVGEGPIDAMEQMLRDKLNQRTASGPAQLRRNFKYFDRDASGDIDLDEFMFALDLMGLSFNYDQTVALFARYDRSISGTFDYQDFCDVLMEFDFGSIAKTSTGSNLKKMMANIFDFEQTTSRSSIDSRSSTNSSQNSSDEEDFESSANLSCIDVHHVRRIFDMLDRDGNGNLDMNEIQDLLEALGVTNLSHEQLVRGMSRLDMDGNNKVDFDEFFEWYSKHATR